MTRFFWMFSLGSLLVVTAGCGTLCNRKPLCCNGTPPKGVFVPPPPPQPLVPAGALVPGPGVFPTIPPENRPPAGFPTTPPSITPMAPKEVPPGRIESKWQPGEATDTKPRVQLYAPETIDKQGSGERKTTTFPPIAQFADVTKDVYTGMRPNEAGFDWLRSNKIGTVIQIRLFGEDDSADKKASEDRGMRYVAFEVSPVVLSKEKVDAFIALIRESSSKGVYVYDQDGSLAGSMWYLYFRIAETLNDETAQLRSRPLGLQNTREGQHREMWLAVQKLLSEQ